MKIKIISLIVAAIFTATSVSWSAPAPSALRPLMNAERVGWLPLGVRAKFIELYRDRGIVLLANRHDNYGINSGHYSDRQIVDMLEREGVTTEFLKDILDTGFMGRENGVVVALNLIKERLPPNYERMQSDTRKHVLSQCIYDFARIRVQGTDGWRGNKVESGKALNITDLSPENMAEYVYAQVRLLIESGAMQLGDKFVVGYDPRDPESLYRDAVLDAVQSAGATAVDAGILSTPLVPLYMLYSGAKGAVVITASHNAKNQIGTKLFLEFQGLKLFPEDEFKLTARFYKVHNEGYDRSIQIGELINEDSGKVRDLLLRIHRDPRNSWALDENGQEIESPFKGTILVVDAAKGALSTRELRDPTGEVLFRREGLAAELFTQMGAEVYEVTKDEGDGEVNLHSGPGNLEGFSTAPVTFEMAHDQGLPTCIKAFQEMFELGRQNKDRILRGEADVAGVLIDADGDRLYVLHYCPFGYTDENGKYHEDYVILSSGDETAFIQGAYLISNKVPPQWKDAEGRSRFEKALFVNTVESDFVAASNAGDLGYTPDYTGVGDKWVLLRSALAWAEASIEVIKNKLPEASRQGFEADIQRFRARLDEMKKSPKVNSAEIKQLMTDLYGMRDRAGIPQAQIDEELIKPGVIKYAVGSEESGHNITMMVMKTKAGRTMPVYFGNALKSSVNTFMALRQLQPRRPQGQGAQERFNWIARPFEAGYKTTLYAYYVDKDKLALILPVLKTVIEKTAVEELGRGVEARFMVKPEDPNMLYYGLFRGGKQIGAVFVRNSGTEKKTSIYGRGPTSESAKLFTIASKARDYIAMNMTDRADAYAMAEALILQKLSDAGRPLTKNELRDAAIGKNPDLENIDFEVLFEVLTNTSREHVISFNGSAYELTPRGRWYLRAVTALNGAALETGAEGDMELAISSSI